MTSQRTILLVVLVAACSSSLAAQSVDFQSELSRIASLASAADRLAAYDKLATLARASAIVVPESRWELDIEQDPIDDSVEWNLTLKSNEQWLDMEPYLGLRSKHGELDLFVHFDSSINDEETYVVIRMDKEKAAQYPWATGYDESAHAPKSDITPFIKNLLSHQSLAVQYHFHWGEARVLTFDLPGLAANIDKLVTLGLLTM